MNLLVIASRPSDFVEMADLARALTGRGHRLRLLYFFERADPSHGAMFEALRALRSEGIEPAAVDHETAQVEPLSTSARAETAMAPAPAVDGGAALGGLRAVATWLRRRGLDVYPRNARLTRLAYELARDVDGMRDQARWAQTVRMTRARGPQLKKLGVLRRLAAVRRIHQGAAMMLHYQAFWRLFRETIADHAIDALLIPEDIVGKVWPVAIGAAHECGVPALVLPYTLANRSEAVQGLKDLPEFQTANNKVAAQLYPRWRLSDGTVDLVRLPSPHVFAHEELGITPPDPWMMNSGYADRILVDSQAGFDYFKAGGVGAEQMAVVGSVSQDRMHDLRQHRREALQRLRESLRLQGTKPLLVVSGCPNQLSAPVPFCEFMTMEEVARVVGESVASLRDHYHLVVRPHPNFLEFGSMLEPFGVATSTEPTSSLVPLADAFIAFASATIRWAIACSIPTINYDVFHYGYGDFAAAAGVRSVTGREQFRDAVRGLVPQSAEYRQLAANAARGAAQWSVMDGRGAQRIEDEIQRARERRRQAIEEQPRHA